MTKIGDILLTIVVALLILYYCLLGLIFVTVADNPSLHNTSSFDKLTPILSILGLGIILYSFRCKTKTTYLMTRILGVVLVLPLIITDYSRSYTSDLMSDKIISATFNFPNFILLIFIVCSIFRRHDFLSNAQKHGNAANR
jgi:hypothetical protein